MVDNNLHRVYLVGAGPGDPDLLTIKAVKALRESNVVLYDELVHRDILDYCHHEAKLICVGKHKGHHSLSQERLNRLTLKMALDYPVVTRLKGGDPFIFGRGGEEYEYLIEHGLRCEIIPGITAVCGAVASIGMPLTHRNYSSELVFLTGHRKKDFENIPFADLCLKDKTHVIYMGLSRLEEIMERLCHTNETHGDVPVVLIEKATRKDQRVFTGTVATISDEIRDLGVTSPALIIIGRVVHILKRLNDKREDGLMRVYDSCLIK